MVHETNGREACAEGTGIAFLFVSLLCQQIFASLVIHGFDPRNSLIEDPVVRGHCQRNTEVHADEESQSIQATVDVSA